MKLFLGWDSFDVELLQKKRDIFTPQTIFMNVSRFKFDSIGAFCMWIVLAEDWGDGLELVISSLDGFHPHRHNRKLTKVEQRHHRLFHTTTSWKFKDLKQWIYWNTSMSKQWRRVGVERVATEIVVKLFYTFPPSTPRSLRHCRVVLLLRLWSLDWLRLNSARTQSDSTFIGISKFLMGRYFKGKSRFCSFLSLSSLKSMQWRWQKLYLIDFLPLSIFLHDASIK